MDKNVLMEAALGYARRGWKVIPLHSIVGSKCSCNNGNCESAGKHPQFKAWKGAVTIDPKTVRNWWRTWPEANIGIATGKNSVVVIDVQGQQGDENFRRLCEEHKYTCSTVTAVSPNGRQHYYRHPGWSIRKSARTIADGMDVRGDGGYVVAPPSVDENGAVPSWKAEGQELQDLPPWLFEMVRPPASDTGGTTSKAMPSTMAEAKETMAQRLIRLAGAASLFHNEDREGHRQLNGPKLRRSM